MYLMSYSSTLEAVWKYSMNWGLWWQVFKKDSIGKGYRLHFLFLGHKKQLGEITLKVRTRTEFFGYCNVEMCYEEETPQQANTGASLSWSLLDSWAGAFLCLFVVGSEWKFSKYIGPTYKP